MIILIYGIKPKDALEARQTFVLPVRSVETGCKVKDLLQNGLLEPAGWELSFSEIVDIAEEIKEGYRL